MSEEELIEFFDKLILAAQVFQVHGITTHKESVNIHKRLVKYVDKKGYQIEHVGFRQFKVRKKEGQ